MIKPVETKADLMEVCLQAVTVVVGRVQDRVQVPALEMAPEAEVEAAPEVAVEQEAGMALDII